jgi:hypothetical protein
MSNNQHIPLICLCFLRRLPQVNDSIRANRIRPASTDG